MSELLATTLVMIEKDKEILKLKAELARQQNSIQQTSEQTLAKQQRISRTNRTNDCAKTS